VRCSSFARRSAWAAAVALALLPACQVSTSIGVDARADGSGVVRATVTLDRDAVAQAGDLAGRLRVDDLRAAGWRIEGPRAVAGGGSEVRAAKAFATPAEATTIVSQLAGEDGPFQSFRLRRSRSFLKTRTSFSGVVDLSRGLGSFSDDELRARLGDPAGLGFDPAELEARLGRTLARVFPVRVVARLPGSLASSNAPTEADNGAQWSPTFGERVTLRASAERWNTLNIAAAVVAILGALALLALTLRRRLSRT
jgi:hypothetical protein